MKKLLTIGAVEVMASTFNNEIRSWNNWQMVKGPNNRMNIGPQYAKDNPFMARMRFHQSWYRSES